MVREVVKRDGRKVAFDKDKIVSAVLKAFKEVDGDISPKAVEKAKNIADYVESLSILEPLEIEQIQDYVEKGLMSTKRKDVAKAYILYRQERTEHRNLETNLKKKFKQVESLMNGTDEESNKENSNKDIRLIPTMRDYIAGFTCREIAEGFMLPKNIVEAHRDAVIHFHDTDYSPLMPMNNCGLINLEDMLQNGTVISGVMIEPPSNFRVACTIVTQIITQVASSQYGGNTINLAHIAPFVQKSREKIKKNIPDVTDKQMEALIKREISDGVQTIQYQLITMSTTNGQAPFTSVFMYLGDAKNEQEEKDLALIIEEMLRQRIAGVKNPQGHPITTAFPKLLYVLDENNVYPGSKYYYLTELAADCTVHRLVPDYISAKIMRNLKNGDVYGCMGCIHMYELVCYSIDSYEKFKLNSIGEMWEELSKINEVKTQPNGKDLYIDIEQNVLVYDTAMNGFVEVSRIIKNKSNNWVRVTLGDYDRVLTCTDDHPFHTVNRGRVLAKDLTQDDQVMINIKGIDIFESEKPNLQRLYENKTDALRDMYFNQSCGTPTAITEVYTDGKTCYSLTEKPDLKDVVNVMSVTKLDKEEYSYDLTTESDHFEVSGIYSHNCRSFLTADTVNHKYWGRLTTQLSRLKIA